MGKQKIGQKLRGKCDSVRKSFHFLLAYVSKGKREEKKVGSHQHHQRAKKRPQIFALLPVYLLQLCYGLSSGFPAILTPKLLGECSGFKITVEQQAWIVSLENIPTPLVCLVSGYLQQRFGPKKVLACACLPYLLGWLLTSFSFEVRMLYCARVSVGVGHALVATSVYSVEVADRHRRGAFNLWESVSRCSGCLLMYVLAYFFPWEVIAYSMHIFPVLALLVCLRVPESPVFLLRRGKISEASEVLKRLYGPNYRVSERMNVQNLAQIRSISDLESNLIDEDVVSSGEADGDDEINTFDSDEATASKINETVEEHSFANMGDKNSEVEQSTSSRTTGDSVCLMAVDQKADEPNDSTPRRLVNRFSFARSNSRRVWTKDFARNPEMYYKPFLVVMLLSVLQQFSGMAVLKSYIVTIFNRVFQPRDNSPDSQCSPESEAYLSAICIASVRLLSSLLLSRLLLRHRRRRLYLISATLSVASLSAFAACLTASSSASGATGGNTANATGIADNATTTPDVNGANSVASVTAWAALFSACSLVFAVQLGVQTIPQLASGELFPQDARAVFKGLARALTSLLVTTNLLMFPQLQALLGTSGIFFVFAGILAVGAPFAYLVMPETKGLELHQIQEFFISRDKIRHCNEDR